MKAVEKARKGVQETKTEVFTQSLTLINGAFALVAALAWNEAVKALIDKFVKAGSGISSRFIYAISVTIFVVFITQYIKKAEGRFKKDEEQAEEESK